MSIDPAIDSPAVHALRPSRSRMLIDWLTTDRARVIRIASCIVVAGLSLYAGFLFRQWTWDQTAPIHFTQDMNNALCWGNRADKLGIVNIYSIAIAHAPEGNYELDYPPLRMAVFTLWAKWLDRHFPEMVPAINAYEFDVVRMFGPLHRWRSSYEVNRPLLWLNALVESASAFAVFLIVHETLCKAGRPWALELSLCAAIILWLNPALVINSWGRPAWDTWVLPWYLFAILFAGKNRWILSGAMLAIGTMFKGQQLVVVPLFVLWPIFRWDWPALLRWTAGFAIATALILLPWMVTRPTAGNGTIRGIDPPAIAWLLSILLAAAVVLSIRARSNAPRWLARGSLAVALLLLVWPAAMNPGALVLTLLPLVAISAVSVMRWAPWRFQAPTITLLLAVAILACVKLFHGSMDWFTIGFIYGADKFPQLELGGASCLASILHNRYHWSANDLVGSIRIFHHTLPVTINTFLKIVYGVCLALCTWGLARKHAKHDPAWLIAIAAPWLLFFAFAPSMHERYLLWGAGICAVAVGASMGMTLLGILLSAASFCMTINNLLHDGHADQFAKGISPTFGKSLRHFIDGTYPDVGWLVMLSAAIFLYQTLKPSTLSPSNQQVRT